VALTDWLPFLRRPAPVLEERAVVDRTPIGMPPGGAQAYISNYADTGRSITPEQARESPTVYACIRLISSNVSRMEWRVSRRIDGYSTPDKEHPLYRLLNIEPNPLMGGMIWRESMLLDALLYGNAYAYIERDGMGNVIGLHKLRADAVEVSRGQDGFPIYTVMNSFNNRLGTVYQGFDIFHLRAPSLDGLLGETPIYLVRNIIGVELEAEKFVASFFRNGARPAGIIKVAGTLTEEALKRLRTSWQAITGGAENAGRVAILESGYEWQGVSVNPEEAKLVELRSFTRSQIAAAFNVPEHMVGGSGGGFASTEQGNAEFVKHCLGNWASRLEEECARKLIRKGDPIETRISFDSLVRGDMGARFSAYSVALNNGFMTINEAREREGLQRIDGGDMARAPVNLAVVDPNITQPGDAINQQLMPPPAPAALPGGTPAQMQGGTKIPQVPGSAILPPEKPKPEAMQMASADGGFDDATQGCINAKIPKLIEEGYPQDQAVAIAISMCSEKNCADDPDCGCETEKRDCGTGAGGFKPGNDCARGGGGGSDRASLMKEITNFDFQLKEEKARPNPDRALIRDIESELKAASDELKRIDSADSAKKARANELAAKARRRPPKASKTIQMGDLPISRLGKGAKGKRRGK